MNRVTIVIALVALVVAQRARAAGEEISGLAAAAAIEEAFVAAIAAAEGSVVAITRDRIALPEGGRIVRGRDGRADRIGPDSPGYVPNEFGAGVVIDSNGLILTNYHLVRGGPIEGKPDVNRDQSLYVRLADRRGFEARIFAADPRSDLAVLKIPAADLKPIRLGNASQARKGQLVIALGNPYMIARDGSASASWGIISNLYRRLATDPEPNDPDSARREKTLQNLGVLIQIDTRLELGTSGGALINLRGELIGITTALAGLVGYEKASGFALPVDDSTRRIIETLRHGKEVEYGFLGISLPSPDDPAVSDLVREFGPLTAKSGQNAAAKVENVLANLPADRAGIRPGDFVTRVGDRPIFGPNDLMREIGLLAPGTRVPIKVWRRATAGVSEVELSVEVGKWPVADEEGVVAANRLHEPWRGLEYDYQTSRRRSARLDLQGPRSTGVMVTGVAPGSPAAGADLRPEDLITQVNRRPVRTPREFADAVQNETGPVTLDVIPAASPKGAPRSIEVKPR